MIFHVFSMFFQCCFNVFSMLHRCPITLIKGGGRTGACPIHFSGLPGTGTPSNTFSRPPGLHASESTETPIKYISVGGPRAASSEVLGQSLSLGMVFGHLALVFIRKSLIYEGAAAPEGLINQRSSITNPSKMANHHAQR